MTMLDKALDQILCNLDSVGYTEKPKEDAAAIRGRLANGLQAVEPAQLFEAIQRGQSFTPAAMTGTTGDTWQSQQIICADIDNDNERHERLEKPLYPAEARQVLEAHGITPTFMYKSFRYRDEWPKYRVMLILDQAITDKAEAQEIGRKVTALLNEARPMCADTKVAEPARFFFGGRPDCEIWRSITRTPLEALRALPDPGRVDPPKTDPAKKTAEAFRDEDARTQADIESFDMVAYLQGATGSTSKRKGHETFFNPCPMCGHNDCFHVSAGKPHLWKCESSGHDGISGGTIIDFLMGHDGLTKAGAFDTFKYSIMRYQRPDWRTDQGRALEWDSPIHDQDPGADPGEPEAPKTPEEIRQAAKPDNVLDYLLSGFTADIRRFDDSKKTGFPNLDKKLGGLYPGLYCLAAISSLGKTTFILQVADNLAEAGYEVVFFSLEQSRFELVAKSLARAVNYQTEDGEPPTLTSLDIRRGNLQGNKAAALKEAIKEYSKAAERLNIVEGNFNFTVSRIRDYLTGYIERNQMRPVVVIDYLQIIQPDEAHKRQSSKEVVDANISELKRISRDLALTVFVICSVNRGNYLTPIDFESLKESGGIEYTADCVLGLQLAAVEDLAEKATVTEKRQTLKAAKAANPREVELVCLKNRNGAPSFECHFLYYPAKDLYMIDQAREAQAEREDRGEALAWDTKIV